MKLDAIEARARAAGAAALSPVVAAILRTLEREAPPGVLASYVQSYAEALPDQRRAIWACPELSPVLKLDLPSARLPRLRSSLDGLFRWLARAGIDPSEALGAPSAHDLLRTRPTLEALVSPTLFGAHLPMAGLYPEEREVLAADLRGGSPPSVVLDHRLSGQVLHELCHGLMRPWTGPSGAWMILEAAASWVAHQVAPAHTFPERVGEGVPGLRGYVLIGHALANRVGADAMLRLALSEVSAEPILGRRLTHALAAAEWQVWRARPAPPFAPDNREAMPWVALIAASDQAAGPLGEALDRISAEPDPGPVSSGSLPVLDAVQALPWSALPWWKQAPAATDSASLHDALLCLCTAERRLPNPTPIRCAPPGEIARIDVDACRIVAEPREDGVYLEPATWLFPPPLARALAARGAREILLRGVRPGSIPQAVDLLHDLVSGDESMPPFLEREVREAPVLTVRCEPSPTPIRYPGRTVSVGSCFAESVATRMASAGFSCSINPFGTLYEPVSIARAVQLLAAPDAPTTDHLFRDRGRWHSRWFHTSFSRRTREETTTACADALTEGRRALATADLLVITWGTAVCYLDAEAGDVVANCHGLDPSRFTRTRLAPDDIVAHTLPAIDAYLARRPGGSVVITVSPVRHLDRGTVENSRSKAALLLAAEQLCAARPQVHYFPAFEIILDELRDHRWFHEDGVHPSNAAVDRVADAFFETWIHPRSRREVARRQDLQRDIQHLPRDPWQRLTELRALRHRAQAPPIDPQAPPAPQLLAFIEDALAALSDYHDDVPDPHAPPPDHAAPAPPAPHAAPDGPEGETPHAGGLTATQAPGAESALAAQRERLAPPADPEAVRDAWRSALCLGAWTPTDQLPELMTRARAAIAPLRSPPSDGGALLSALLRDLSEKAEDLEDAPAVLGPLAAQAFDALASRLTASEAGWVDAVVDALYAGWLRLTPELASELSPAARGALTAPLRPPPRRKHPDAHPFKRALDALGLAGGGAPFAARSPVDEPVDG